ncbi:MAG: hypothetical protein HY735_03525 [Verrucomicrobia bacterium]|nr:hypothetical protein [Verrucomicrobiota bacterium]
MIHHTPLFLLGFSLQDWSALLQPGALLVLVLGLAAILVARVIRVQIWLWRVKSLFLAGLLLLAAQVLLYFTVFNRCETLQDTEDGTKVLLLGRVESVHLAARRPGESFFILTDPTGRVCVVTTNGLPAAASICVVSGRKATIFNLPVVVCEFRLSTLGHHQTSPK